MCLNHFSIYKHISLLILVVHVYLFPFAQNHTNSLLLTPHLIYSTGATNNDIGNNSSSTTTTGSTTGTSEENEDEEGGEKKRNEFHIFIK